MSLTNDDPFRKYRLINERFNPNTVRLLAQFSNLSYHDDSITKLIPEYFQYSKRLSSRAYQTTNASLPLSFIKRLSLLYSSMSYHSYYSVNSLELLFSGYISNTFKQIVLSFTGTKARYTISLIADLHVFYNVNYFLDTAMYEKIYQICLEYPNYEIYLTGHSFGGFIAQRVLLENILLSKPAANIQAAYIFNSPGLTQNDLARYIKNTDKANLYHYVTKDDLVSTQGEQMTDMLVTANSVHDIYIIKSHTNMINNVINFSYVKIFQLRANILFLHACIVSLLFYQFMFIIILRQN